MLIVIIFAVALAGAVALMTRGITFMGPNTDNEKMVRAAATLRWWAWPSRMHADPKGRAQTREYWVMALALVQRLLSDRKSDYPNTILALGCHAVSSVLIYLVASLYWSPLIGMLVAVMLLTSFWPYQVLLLIGHVLLSQAILLLAILAVQATEFVQHPFGRMGWYVVGGMFAAVSFFSSASSRKYVPLFFGAFLYSLRGDLVWPPRVPIFSASSGWETIGAAAMGLVAAATVVSVVLMQVSWRRIAHLIYRHRTHPHLKRFMPTEQFNVLEYYEHRLNRFVRSLTQPLLFLSVYLGGIGFIVRSPMVSLAHLAVVVGGLLVVLHVMMPDLLESWRRFVIWFNCSQWAGHFNVCYREFFAKRGIVLRDPVRGAGVSWVYRLFLRFAPFYVATYVAALVYLLFALVAHGFSLGALGSVAGLTILSLAPIIVGEWTRGIHGAKSYYPGFMGLLILIAAAVHHVDQQLSGSEFHRWFWLACWMSLALNAAWNIRVFVTDVWPARMAPVWLGKTLRRLGITTFSTYRTPYNDAFVGMLPQEDVGRYDIRYIKGSADAATRFVVVPGTSSKALNIETYKYASSQGDFNEDPLLTQLIETRRIEHYAVESFKTFGTSRMWTQEGDVISYFDLILREVTEQDRWRGRAWILDMDKLRRSPETLDRKLESDGQRASEERDGERPARQTDHAVEEGVTT